MAKKKKVSQNVPQVQNVPKGEKDQTKFELAKSRNEAVSRLLVSKPAGEAECIDCGAKYKLSSIQTRWYSPNGTSRETEEVLPKHGRCERCQTIHLFNGRAQKFITACEHLRNVSKRMTAEEKQAFLPMAEECFRKNICEPYANFEPDRTKAEKPTFNIADYV